VVDRRVSLSRPPGGDPPVCDSAYQPTTVVQSATNDEIFQGVRSALDSPSDYSSLGQHSADCRLRMLVSTLAIDTQNHQLRELRGPWLRS
jgi:hypothetical protein